MSYCKTCRGQKPDVGCDSCEWGSPLFPENEEAFELWLSVRTQWRASGFGLVGLVYSEVRAAARRLDIDLSPCTDRKIRVLEAETLAMQAEAKKPGGKPHV